MGRSRDFEIAFVGLKPGLHEFDFLVQDKFFEDFQQQDFRNCQAHVKLVLDKQPNFLLLKFEIGGTMEVTCDRCNNNLPLELWDEFRITVKMADDPEGINGQDDDPDIYYISRSESHIDVSGWIYEFINLSLPIQKTCGFEKMNGPHCNPEAMDILKKLGTDENKKKENPIWKGLKKFKNPE